MRIKISLLTLPIFSLFAFADEPAVKVCDAATIDKQIYSCYRSFWPELDVTTEFGRMGVNTRCFFAANTINSIGFEYCKYPSIWNGIKKYDFTAYDKQVDDLIKANPDGEFLCLIDLNTPYWLTRKFAYDSFDVISHAASDPQWFKITTEWMRDFIEYSEKKYGEKIKAYILSGGGTSEWYEYDRGKSSRVKNTAWRNWCKKNGFSFGDDVPVESVLNKAFHENVIYDPATEPEKIRYWQFHNEVIAGAILHYAKEARSMLDRKKEIGVFFGYYMVSDSKLVSFGHLDYERVFACPDIDFVISPGTYNDRLIGGGTGPQLVQGTALRHGKRYLHEIDHRTHKAGGGNSWKNQAEDEAGLKREVAYSLVNHDSYWWFDMWGGWFNEPATRKLISQLQQITERFAGDRSASMAEVLLIADPQSAYYVNEKMPHASAMARKFREAVSRTGAPYDVYSFNDIPVINMSRYKVICLPATLLINSERAEILKKHVMNSGRTLVWVYAPGITDGNTLDVNRIKEWTGTEYRTEGPSFVAMDDWTSVYSYEYKTMTPAVLRDVCKRAGVHLYVDEVTPVFVNERLLAVHCKEGGSKKIYLPRKCSKVMDVLSNKVVSENVSEFTYEFASPDTVIFEMVK